MGWTLDLLEGLAEHVAGAGIATWDPDGDTGDLVLGALGSKPGNGIGLTEYNLQADPTPPDVTQPVQFWIRGTETYVRQTADSLFELLDGALNLTLGGVACQRIALHSDAQMGVDQTGRRERAVNYDIYAMRPTSTRTD